MYTKNFVRTKMSNQIRDSKIFRAARACEIEFYDIIFIYTKSVLRTKMNNQTRHLKIFRAARACLLRIVSFNTGVNATANDDAQNGVYEGDVGENGCFQRVNLILR